MIGFRNIYICLKSPELYEVTRRPHVESRMRWFRPDRLNNGKSIVKASATFRHSYPPKAAFSGLNSNVAKSIVRK